MVALEDVRGCGGLEAFQTSLDGHLANRLGGFRVFGFGFGIR